MYPNNRRFNVNGFTLIEIIVTIVVLAIASTTLLSVFTSTVSTSVNPMIQQQAISIAEAYMEEIMLKSFDDPDGSGVEATRPEFDDVRDYNGITNESISDQNGSAATITALNAYRITVKVTNEELYGIDAAYSLRIDIEVTHPAISSIEISGYRTKY
jgi:MSHA pilin protein MshD